MTLQTCTLILALLLSALSFTGCGEGDTPAQPGGATDHPAPPSDWSMPVLDTDAFARLREEAAAAGQVLVVDCWATWCSSCVAMFPQLHEAMAQRGEKVRLVSLCYDENTNDGEDYLAKARAFVIDQHAWKNAYLVDPASKQAIGRSLSEDFGGALPAVFVLGKDGQLVFAMLETRGEVADWVADIAKAVDAAGD